MAKNKVSKKVKCHYTLYLSRVHYYINKYTDKGYQYLLSICDFIV